MPICVATNDAAKVEFAVRVFCPAREAMALEQAVTADFMAFYHQQRRR